MLSFCAQAQKEIDRHLEYGFMLGGTNYSGDLIPRYSFRTMGPAGAIFYRHNYPNEVSVLRLNLMMGQLSASEDLIDEPLRQNRQLSFNSGIIELSALYEYDFFNFRDLKDIYYTSPYLFGGAGLGITFEGKAHLVIPFGVGIKFNIAKKLNLGLEFGARKTFTDSIDQIDEDDATLLSSYKNDWYYFTGISFSKTVYKQVCPEK